MVTKRTRLLSIITTALMLVSMFACFVIPASAEDVTIGDLVAKYEILDPANFNEAGAVQIEAARAQLATYAAQYEEQTDEAVRAEIVNGAIAYEASITEALQGTVNADAELPYAYKGYYEALGYTTEATTYLITNYEDWMAAAAAQKGWGGITLKVTADIDFTGKEAAPLVPACSNKDNPEYQFKGTLDGQGHKLINMNLSLSGCYAAPVAGNAKTATIKNLGIEGGSFNFTKGGTDWYSYGSFIGRSEGSCKLINCWSTMAISGANSDGKTGTAGLLGMGESGDVIDNCFFAGSINNTAGPATDTVGYGGGVGGTDVYNTIGAGTLVAATNPVAMGGWHANIFEGSPAGNDVLTGAQDGTTRQVFHNAYAVGHDAIRFRANQTSYSHSGASYFGETPFSAAAMNKVHTAASLEEAAWLVNSNFDTKYQEAQTYFFDVVDGKLCFTTDADTTLKQVIISGDAEGQIYLHAGETINLISDLGLQSQIESVVIEGYEDAVDAEWNLTVPNADIEVFVTYNSEAILGAAIAELEEILAKYEAVDFDLFTDGDGEMAEWYEYAVEGIELEDIDQIEDAIAWETELTVELKDGAYPPFAKYDAYKAFNPAGWGISSMADWLAVVEKTTATDGSAANFLGLSYHLTQDIDMEEEVMAPMGYGFTFTGNLYGHGYAFKNVNIQASAVTGNNAIALISAMGGGGYITEVGVASGIVNGDGGSEHNVTAGLVGSVETGAFKMIKCWNGATINSDNASYATAGGLVGVANNKDGLLINGAYNIGNVTSNGTHGTAENYAGAILGSGTAHYADALVNMFNAGVITKAPNSAAARADMLRVNKSVSKIVRNVVSVTALDETSYGTGGADCIYEAVTILGNDAYETGYIGYYMNQYYTRDGFVALKDDNGAALEHIYFTVDANGAPTFGTEANQTRKVEFTGSIIKTVYVAAGSTMDLAAMNADAEYAVATDGYESALSGKVLTVPNADIVINVTGDVVDAATYENAKTILNKTIAKYADLDTTIVSNGDAIAQLVTDAEAALAADAAESTNTTKNAVIALAVTASATTPVLAEGMYVPYAQKDTAFEGVAANSNYGIYNAADWAAFVAAGNNGGKTIHLMKNITLDASAPIFGANQFTGTFDGHNNTLTVAVTATVADGQTYGVFGSYGTIKNLKLAGTLNIKIGTASNPVANRTFFGAISGGSATLIDNCENAATITAEVYGLKRVWVAGVSGDLGVVKNSTNSGNITVTGFAGKNESGLGVGGIGGRTNQSCSNLTNTGNITVIDTSAAGSGNHAIVGGIYGSTAGNDLTNATNSGTITVTGGDTLRVGGIQGQGTDTNANYIKGTLTNTGAINVTANVGAKEVSVGGIFGAMMWPADAEEGVTVSNSGNITVDAGMSTKAYIGGIAGTASAKVTTAFATSNSGALWIGGLAQEGAKVSQKIGSTALEFTGADTGSITFCAHSEYSSEDDALNAVTNHDCNDCSYTWQTALEGVDTVYEQAKVTLEALVAKYEALNADLFTNGADMTAALSSAKAVLAADAAESNPETVQAVKDEAAKTQPTLTLKEDAKVPYSKKALYTEYGASTTVFGIYEANDWIQLTVDFYGKACSLTLYVMKDIDFNHTNMSPLSYGSGIVCNAKIYGQDHTFENIKIEMEGGTNQYQGVSLIAAMQNAEIHDLGVTGNITNTATSTSARTAVFNGGAAAGGSPLIKNCWSSVTVRGPSSNRAQYLAVFHATVSASHRIENCINYGEVISTSTNGAVSVFYSYGAQAAMKNSLDLGTQTPNGSGIAGAIASHHNGISTFINMNSYSVSNFWAWTHSSYESEIAGYNLTIPGTTTPITTAQQVRDYLAVGSAAEAAWRATNGANGAVYYKLDDTKGVVFGTATDRVQKITFTGDYEAVVYANNGDTITLSDVLDNATFDIGGEAITTDAYTVPNADVTINVTSGSSVDLIAYEAAKAELEAIVAKFGALNVDLFTNGADITAAKDDAAAVLAADAESNDVTKQAVIDEAAKADVVPALKADAKVPYSKKAAYADYLPSGNKVFGIYEAADWLAIVNDNAGGNQYYVMNNVDFDEVEMLPLGYSQNTGLTGLLDGQGYAFLNINVVASRSTNWRTGVSLVSGMNGGTIKNLGLTGKVTNTTTEATYLDGSTTRTVLTAAFSAGKNNGSAWTIENCWSDVHVKGPSTATAGLAVFNCYAGATDTIKNCINYGRVESTTNGSAAVVYSAASAAATASNCINLGDFVTTGAAAAVILHSNQASLYTNSYSVGTNNVYLRDSATYDNTNMVEAGAAAWNATNGAAGAVYYKLDATKGIVFGSATDRVQKITFAGDVEAVVYLNNGSTITLADIHDDATFTIEGTPIAGDTYTVPNADVTITVTDNTPECEHKLGETVWVDGSATHIFVCGECGETVGEAESCEAYLTWAEDDGAKTHSATCTECGHTYTEDCVGTEKSNAADCTQDHWYEYDCDRANETIPGSGADAHVWGEWTTEGATEGYQRHDCANCDAYEEELLPLEAPVIVITANEGKAGDTGVEFTVTLTVTGVKSGTLTIALPAWAENVNLVAGENVTIEGNVATITGNIAAGSVLLTGTYDIDTLAGEAGVITVTAANVLNEREETVTVANATADATIDVVLGDAKVDGVVNLIDAIAVLRSVAGLDTDVNEFNGDVDASGALSADDAVLIVRFWLGDPTYNGPVLG